MSMRRVDISRSIIVLFCVVVLEIALVCQGVTTVEATEVSKAPTATAKAKATKTPATKAPEPTDDDNVEDYEFPDDNIEDYEFEENAQNVVVPPVTKTPVKTSAPAAKKTQAPVANNSNSSNSSRHNTNSNSNTNNNTNNNNNDNDVAPAPTVAATSIPQPVENSIKIYFYNNLRFKNVKITCVDSNKKAMTTDKSGDAMKASAAEGWYRYDVAKGEGNYTVTFTNGEKLKTVSLMLKAYTNHWIVMSGVDNKGIIKLTDYSSVPENDLLTRIAISKLTSDNDQKTVNLDDDLQEKMAQIEEKYATVDKFLGKEYNDNTTEKVITISVIGAFLVAGIVVFLIRKFRREGLTGFNKVAVLAVGDDDEDDDDIDD